MNIAVVGGGNIGSGLARVLSKSDNNVVVADLDGGGAAAAKLEEEGVTVAPADVASAIKDAELVILVTLFAASKQIASSNDLSSKVVVDVSNPVTEDFSALQVGHSTSAAGEIAALAAGAKVVKAFNTVFAQHYAGDLQVGGRKIQTFVASDDDAAKAKVIALAEETGLEVRDAGGLTNARYLEPLGYMNSPSATCWGTARPSLRSGWMRHRRATQTTIPPRPANAAGSLKTRS